MSARIVGPPTIAVGGGKGGVGKSVVAANLAVAMGRLGFRTILFDADLGAANQHTLFGIDHPSRTVQAFFDGEVQSLEEVVEPTGVERVFVIPGTGAVAGSANIPHARKLKLIRHLRRLEADAVIIDCGAGSSFNVVDFFNVADVRLLVASPQLTSLQNAYAFLKNAVYRSLGAHAQNARQRDLFKASTGHSETERLGEVVERVARQDSAFGLELAHAAATYETMVVANQVEYEGQSNVMYALCRMIGDFLSTAAELACSLPVSTRIHASVTRRVPFVVRHPASIEARAMERLAESILVRDFAELRSRRSTVPDGGFEADASPSVPPLGRYLRRHHRYRVRLPASVETRGRTLQANVVDVSLSGAALSGQLEVSIGEVVWVRVPAFQGPPFQATIRGVGGGRTSFELTGTDAEQQGAALVEMARRHQAA